MDVGERIIQIPFSAEMREANRDGRKFCTTRRERIGPPGTRFDDGTGRVYRIVMVEKVPLRDVRDTLCLYEGVETPEEFEALWRSLHRGHFSADREYFVHWYSVEE